MTSQEQLQNGLTLRYFLSCRGNAHYDRGATQTPPQASRLILRNNGPGSGQMLSKCALHGGVPKESAPASPSFSPSLLTAYCR
ncbi:hypothetical protein F9C07_1177 [Aspergillus flavus]|uniref:Uncharacterized protein n=1 Tax=Aspergillus flavus (strain ATCC 200026 / FGSC A1120 / IAM 13836 / NRRL 3357 / JCM 12722 / SRRC 167) TaxID=332952 RepID=A0A7U2QXA3_ASPFN|nr:hypothetical protein F9C07_1177 [Aspergillus flavus]